MNRRWDPTIREIFVLMHFEIENGKITRMDDFPLDPFALEEFYTPPDAWGSTNANRAAPRRA